MSFTPTYDGSGANLARTADVRDNLDEAIRAAAEFGAEAQLEADKALAQILDPPAEQLGQAYDLLQEVLDARDRDSAEGVHLDNMGNMVNVPRQGSTYSTTVLRFTGTPATVIAITKRSRVPGTTTVFWVPVDEVTIPGGGTIDAPAACTVIGAQEASDATITEIVDSVSGWTGITNVGAAATGDEIEADPVYRRRQKSELSAGGTARAAAIRSKLVALDFVSAAAVIENLDLVTDARGIPGKAYRPVVWPTGLSAAQEQLVIDALYQVTPAGIYVDGTERYTVTDDQGYAQEYGFEYGTQVEIYSVANLTVTSDYPTTGDADVEAAMKVFDNAYTLGSKVLPDDIVDYVRSVVPGIDHIDLRIKFGSAPGASDTVPLYPDVDERPYFDTNVTVNS